MPQSITGNVWSFVYHKFLGLCHTFSLNQAEDLDIDDSRQFLDSVEQDVALLYDGLILRILRVWSVRHDDSTNLVDLAVEPPIGNQPAQLPIHVVLGHVESLGHVSWKDSSYVYAHRSSG